MIEIYTTLSCIYCTKAKEYFDKNNIEYIEYDVVKDIKKRKEMVEITGQTGVPVIRNNDKVIVGFNEMEIRELLS